jgi:hypothetical protein
MSTASRPADHGPGRRRLVARGLIIVYFFLGISLVLTIADKDRHIAVRAAQWAAWGAAAVPLTAGFVLALRVLGADRGCSVARTRWAAALTVLGVVIVAADLIGLLPRG